MRKILLLLTTLLAFPLLALDRTEAAILAREAEQLFNEANDLSRTDHAAAIQKWQMAAARLERLDNEGKLSNGPLFYNLGNIHFRLGHIGDAILYYRRAELYTPNDTNLRENLAFVRRSRQDNIPEQEAKRVLKTLFFWHYDFAIRTRENITILLFGILFSLLTFRLFHHRRWLTALSLTVAAFTLVSTASITISLYSFYHNRPGVITANEVTARKGNSNSYEPAFETPLHAGTEFTLLEQRPQWLHIQLPNGQQCWLPT
ncbi:MAG: hypothetical protein IJJ26_11460, partial [Victivallales bacterium]|nr:hypothetical protein [Victivallales bacterium]